jgi:hypothetical protein
MPARPLEDLSWLAHAKVDRPRIEQAMAGFERSERGLHTPGRLTELGMELAEAAAQSANGKLQAATRYDAAPISADPSAAFGKIAQTIRQTIWFDDRLAEHLKIRRAGPDPQRETRESNILRGQPEDVGHAVNCGLVEVIRETFDDPNFERPGRLSNDTDEFREYVERAPRETISRLCATVGLDPNFCLLDGDPWITRRPPCKFETSTAGEDLSPSPFGRALHFTTAPTGDTLL